jgi:methionyl-tRNA formyltransferase
VERLVLDGEQARFCSDAEQVGGGGIAFYLGCIRVTPREILERNPRNLVVHESDLPQGRGFSPMTWQILQGRTSIPVCLLEAVDEVDGGPVIYRDALHFAGHELIDELRAALGAKTLDLCLRFLSEPLPLRGEPQCGVPSRYPRRHPLDSKLDPHKSFAEQFNLLRVVDNQRYPAFFELHGWRYKIQIEKMPQDEKRREIAKK